jgi:hypothetical protein
MDIMHNIFCRDRTPLGAAVPIANRIPRFDGDWDRKWDELRDDWQDNQGQLSSDDGGSSQQAVDAASASAGARWHVGYTHESRVDTGEHHDCSRFDGPSETDHHRRDMHREGPQSVVDEIQANSRDNTGGGGANATADAHEAEHHAGQEAACGGDHDVGDDAERDASEHEIRDGTSERQPCQVDVSSDHEEQEHQRVNAGDGQDVVEHHDHDEQESEDEPQGASDGSCNNQAGTTTGAETSESHGTENHSGGGGGHHDHSDSEAAWGDTLASWNDMSQWSPHNNFASGQECEIPDTSTLCVGEAVDSWTGDHHAVVGSDTHGTAGEAICPATAAHDAFMFL